MGSAMRERVFGHMRQCRLRSAYASAQSDQSRHCPLTKQLEQRPGCYFAYAQDDLNQRILRIFEGTSTLDEAHISLRKHAYSNILKILQPKHGQFSDEKF